VAMAAAGAPREVPAPWRICDALRRGGLAVADLWRGIKFGTRGLSAQHLRLKLTAPRGSLPGPPWAPPSRECPARRGTSPEGRGWRSFLLTTPGGAGPSAASAQAGRGGGRQGCCALSRSDVVGSAAHAAQHVPGTGGRLPRRPRPGAAPQRRPDSALLRSASRTHELGCQGTRREMFWRWSNTSPAWLCPTYNLAARQLSQPTLETC
jgi:hypothetical protein